MARAVSIGVRELFDLARVGEFSLPAELVQSFEACLTIQRLDMGKLDLLDVDRGAEQIIATARRREPLDLVAELAGRGDATGGDGL
jgi:hypothetical protein